MINSDRVALLKKTSTYYKTRNKGNKLQKQINLIQNKNHGTN